MKLKDGTPVGCVEAGHASYIIRKPNNAEGCAKIPEGVDMAAASMYVMTAVALNGLAQAQPEATETVLVYGLGLGDLHCGLANLNQITVWITHIASNLRSTILGLGDKMCTAI